MSNAYDPASPDPSSATPGSPRHLQDNRLPPQPSGSVLGSLFLASKILINLVVLVTGLVFVAVILLGLAHGGADNILLRLAHGGADNCVNERHYAGKSGAKDKIAVIRIEGVLMEGMTSYFEKQIDEAAEDDSVKAVVLRINSPGGSITASDNLHRRIMELREGNTEKNTPKKKIVVSMGGIAASGGYYISMPAEKIFAEQTTLTGSIGVIAVLPNLTGIKEKYGVTVETVKAGSHKDSGSMFRDMTPEDQQLWHHMIDHAYGQFQKVVEEGRKKQDLQGKLLTNVSLGKTLARDKDGNIKKDSDGKPVEVDYVRQRADGFIFNADEALKLDLIDKIDYLDAAIQEAKTLASLGPDYDVITYDKPQSLASVLGFQSVQPDMHLAADRLAAASTPRIWFLASQSELAWLLTCLGR